MYSESDLEAAVTAGAISPDAAIGLRNFVAASRATPVVDEEHFRLLTGFNDIFVAIAAIILLLAIGWMGNTIPPHIEDGGPSPFSGLLVAVAAWGLAEFFTRKRRMALPSILLLLAFIGGVLGASFFTLAVVIGEQALDNDEALAALIAAASAGIAAGAAWLHWRRFRVPITVAAGTAALAGLVLALVGYAVGDAERLRNVMLGVALTLGVGVFLLAMWWDGSDPRRETRRSDVAFWLHLLAAPMIVHPIFSLMGLTDGSATAAEAGIVVLVYLVFVVAALAIDRRALLVSALAYVLWALTDLFERFGAVELSFALTAFVIGSALLLLSAFWHTARAAVVRNLSPSLQARLPVLDRLSPQPAS
jgi:hypothetical protein